MPANPAQTAHAPGPAELLARFEALHADLLDFTRACSADGWQATTADEGWRAGVTIHHVGAIHYPVIEQVQAMRDGRPLTVTTMADVERLNAAHVLEHAACTPTETIAFLEREAARVRDCLHALADADLDLTADIPFMGGTTTAGRLLQVVLLDLAAGHLQSARTAGTRLNAPG